MPTTHPVGAHRVSDFHDAMFTQFRCNSHPPKNQVFVLPTASLPAMGHAFLFQNACASCLPQAPMAPSTLRISRARPGAGHRPASRDLETSRCRAAGLGIQQMVNSMSSMSEPGFQWLVLVYLNLLY